MKRGENIHLMSALSSQFVQIHKQQFQSFIVSEFFKTDCFTFSRMSGIQGYHRLSNIYYFLKVPLLEGD